MIKNLIIGVLVLTTLSFAGLYVNKGQPLGQASQTHTQLEYFLSGLIFGAETNTPITARSCASVTYNPPSLATNATATTGFTNTGVALGDTLEVSFGTSTQGISLNPYTNTAASTTVLFLNSTGATIDLATGTLKVCYTN